MSLTKVNLLNHFNNGNININFGHSLNSSYNDLFEIFDGSVATANMVVIESNEVASFANFGFNIHAFTGTPQFSVQKVVLSVGVVLTGKLIFNEGRADEQTVNWDTERTSYNTNNINLEITDFTPVENLSSLKVTFDTYHTPTTDGDNDVRLYELAIFIGESTSYQSKRYEFNDSVLTTKAWNSSRYDGRQLSGSKLNKFTAGDSSYGLTPVISNLTRTFYISSDITSLGNTGLRINRLSGAEEEDTENPIEDPSLQYIPDFSYIVVNKSITINKDNSIKITDLSTFNASPDGTNRRTGFNREFQTNIPNGSYIGLKNLDASVKDRSDISYRVYFNAGRLQPIARYINDFSKQDIAGSTTLLKTLKFAVIDPFNQGGSFTIQNRKKVRQFFTGSIQPKTVNGIAVGPSYNEFKSFFRAMSAYRNTNVSKPRFFFSLLNTLGETAPANPLAKDIEVIRTVSSESGFFPTENLAELSTAEITSNGESFSNFILGGSSTFNLNQNYTTEVTTNEVTDPDTGGTITIIAGGSSPLLFSGSYDISFLNENKPSLLVNLNKEIEFPDGIGRTPLVIIPETLHPYIKDNIPQFMAQAGFDIGNITQINALDETNRTLS